MGLIIKGFYTSYITSRRIYLIQSLQQSEIPSIWCGFESEVWLLTQGAANLFYLYDNATLPCFVTVSLPVTWWAQVGKLITFCPAGLKLSRVSARGKFKQHYKFVWGNPHSQCKLLKSKSLLSLTAAEKRGTWHSISYAHTAACLCWMKLPLLGEIMKSSLTCVKPKYGFLFKMWGDFFHYWCILVYKVSVVDKIFGEFDELLYHTL